MPKGRLSENQTGVQPHHFRLKDGSIVSSSTLIALKHLPTSEVSMTPDEFTQWLKVKLNEGWTMAPVSEGRPNVWRLKCHGAGELYDFAAMITEGHTTRVINKWNNVRVQCYE